MLFWIIFLAILPQFNSYLPLHRKQVLPEKGTIKVLSYNVMGFNNLQKDKNNQNRILNYIKSQNPDIVCLQEYAVSGNTKLVTQQDVDKALEGFKYKSIVRVGNKNSYNKLACFSKYPILSYERIDYKSQFNGSIAYRIVVESDTILVVNNHFESNKITLEDKVFVERLLQLEEQHDLIKETKGLLRKIVDASIIREKQAKAVVSYIDEAPERRVIVCGDFNDSPLSRTNKLFADIQLKSAFSTSGFGLGISYNQNMFYFRIDNILTNNNLKAYNCVVDNSIKDSDHYPIMCYIAKK